MRREKEPGKALGCTSDLVVIAPIERRLIQSYDAVTAATRLRLTLRTLAGIRATAREFLPQMPFCDPVERLELIHSYRIAVLPEPERMLLAVTFDGSWEAYMRALWHQAGPMLDLVLTDCKDYPLARESSLAEWSGWVRDYEQPADFFYSAAPLSSSDLGYLSQVERAQRGASDAIAADLAVASLSSPEPSRLAEQVQAQMSPEEVNESAQRIIAAMFRLTRYYGADVARPEAMSLLRATHALLADWKWPKDFGIKPANGAPEPDQRELEAQWFRSLPKASPPDSPMAPLEEARRDVQRGILNPFDAKEQPLTDGALLMFRVVDPDKARRTLAGQSWSAEKSGPTCDGEIVRTVAITYPGLRALELSDEVLNAFPPEFVQGAEARAPRLGDVRGFHPRKWRRPRRVCWPDYGCGEVDLSAVDVIVQLRTRADNAAVEIVGNDKHPLHPAIAHTEGWAGLELLAVEPMKRRADGTNHLGFGDGLTSPVVVAGEAKAHEEIAAGDILLGMTDEPGRRPPAAEFLRNGTFLAIRKMRLHPEAFDAMAESAANQLGASSADEIKRKLVGARPDGTPLLSCSADGYCNDANDDWDEALPRQSHVRRCNPGFRPDGRTPRIVRRGMSFGPDGSGERGIMFMAYCASLAKQFELLQQWVNGGNSTRIGSMFPDPIAGVPRVGGDVFRFIGSTPQDPARKPRRIRVSDAAAPVSELDWMLYAFVPALSTLKRLGEAPRAAAPAAGSPEAGEQMIGALQRLPWPSPDAWQSVLDDPGVRLSGATADFWAAVRQRHGGILASPLGTLVGSHELVHEVLSDRSGDCSVRGYHERFSKSVGPIYLGFDPDNPDYVRQAPAGNKAIGDVGEEDAIRRAYRATRSCLQTLLETPKTVDLLTELIDPVMAQLCREYFTIPDGVVVQQGGLDWRQERGAARCPGDLYSPTRYVFDPTPSAGTESAGQAHGRLLTASIRKLVDSPHSFAGGRISGALKEPFTDDPDLFARTLAGMLTGFVPVTVGNIVNILGLWMDDRRELFRAQEEWLHAHDGWKPLRTRVERAMMQSPAPDFIWRTARKPLVLGGTKIDAGGKLLLCLQSVAQGEMEAGQTSTDIVFGGKRTSDGNGPPHACPGRDIGFGTILGFLAGLFDVADLRLNGSPLSLDMQRAKRRSVAEATPCSAS